jgi:GTP cyclohydrolase I
MGDQIADTLNSLVHAHGVGVYLEAHHLCTQMRGVREMQAMTRTAVWRGEYTDNAQIRSEFFHLAGVGAS